MAAPHQLAAPAKSLLRGVSASRGGAQCPPLSAECLVLEEDKSQWVALCDCGSGDRSKVTFMGRVVICHHTGKNYTTYTIGFQRQEKFY